MTDIAIVDYGMGNLRSVQQALRAVAPGASITVTGDPAIVGQAARVVFPGQGAMPDCMRELDARGLRAAVLQAARSKPFLGICIGLQMLFEHSAEGNIPGLCVLDGSVVRFATDLRDSQGNKLKVPHMGWNQVHRVSKPEHPLWAGIEQDARFYFVHSYYVQPRDTALVQATSDYPQPFTCAVARDNLFAVQFHPEKSQSAGLTLLRNFVNWNPA
ncbi:MAG: imidazole glycerol phosphate synthase subunit HisH [Gallionellaceae bacterium]|nr:imidazole glycerol phosphate synthase subunit HisH [Gallionellaceae bacterium]